MNFIVPQEELESRLDRFKNLMDKYNPEWKNVLIVNKVNQYYFTGTMQEGVLLIFKDQEACYWVRKSFDRALMESKFSNFKKMSSYRDIAQAYGDKIQGEVFLETETMPLAMQQRIFKHLNFSKVNSVDAIISQVRAVKSEYELQFIRKSGEAHRLIMEEIVPTLIKEGITEIALISEIHHIMMEHGHHGVSRMGAFGAEMAFGQIGFGDGSIYPTCFNGPGGAIGMSPAVPGIGSERKLKTGELIFIDMCFGINGYNTDKTMTYVFKGELPDEVVQAHKKCVAIHDSMASKLKVGNIPSKIYQETLAELDSDFTQNFMGFGNDQVKFLGHGIGLVVDEYPVIARGFDLPLEANMTMALEPKKGFAGIGNVGIENTFLITETGGESLTGNNRGLIAVD